MDFIWNAKLKLMTLCLNALLSGSEMRKAIIMAARPHCFLFSVLDKHVHYGFLSYRVHWLVANFQ